MAGAYSASAIREAERLIGRLTEQGKEPVVYAVGRRAISYYTFRGRELAEQWSGNSDAPSVETAAEIAETLLAAFRGAGGRGRRRGAARRVHAVP